MTSKIFVFLLLAVLVKAQDIPTAPTPGQPPPTTTLSTDATFPTAPTGNPGQTTTTTILTEPTDVPTDAPPTTAPPPTDIPTTAPPPTDLPTPAPTTAPPVTCPPTGIHTFPDAENCRAFFTCLNGNRIHNLCPDGFLFDAIRNSCEPSGVVDCGTRPR